MTELTNSTKLSKKEQKMHDEKIIMEKVDELTTEDYTSDTITLYHGECLGKMSLIPDDSIDLVLCDLPYGTTKCKWDTIIDIGELWKHYKRIVKNLQVSSCFLDNNLLQACWFHPIMNGLNTTLSGKRTKLPSSCSQTIDR